MMKAEIFRLALRCPIGAGGFQHHIGAGDIGVNEIPWPVDGSVHMRFSGQMHHSVGLMRGENSV